MQNSLTFPSSSEKGAPPVLFRANEGGKWHPLTSMQADQTCHAVQYGDKSVWSFTEGWRKEAPQHPTSASGAMRASIGTKIKTNLVPYEAVTAMAVGLNYGETKYTARNFEKGLSYTDLLESCKRHITGIENREGLDADSGLPHHTLLASSVAMLCHNIAQEVVVDDRPAAKVGKTTAELAELAQEQATAGARHREALNE